MTLSCRAGLGLAPVLCLAMWSGGADGVAEAGPAQPAASAANPIIEAESPFTLDDQLIVEADVAGQQVSDGLAIYSSRSGLYLPLAGLTRLLDLAVQVDAAHRRAEGWTVSEKQTFLLELKDLKLSIQGRVVAVSPAQFATADGDIYLRQDLLETLLPVKIRAELHQLRLDIAPTQPLPFQQRLERERDRARLSRGVAQDAVTRLDTPYSLYSPPGIDINVDATGGTRSRTASHFDLAAAGDLGFTTAELYLGSAFRMKPDTLRIRFERKDPAGHNVLVPGVTQAMLGDTYTPSLPLGARGGSGRGVAVSTAPLESVSVFDKTDIRGDLPSGYEVELYVNEVLRGSVPSSSDGRYAFTSVALAYGVNTIRLVFYGPHGERREEVRRINVGSGAVPAGQFIVNFGAVEEYRPVVQLQKASLGATPGLRVVAALGYGLTREITLTTGLADYRLPSGRQRQLAVIGAATSFLGYAVQGQGAQDNDGASSLSFGVAGRTLGLSTVLRRTAYFAGFVDEAQGGGDGQRSNTAVSLDGSLPTPGGGLPLNLQATEFRHTDGSRTYAALFQTSKSVQRYLVSAGFSYQGATGGGAPSSQTMSGRLDLSGSVGGVWQLRSSASFPVVPGLRLGTLGLTAQRQIGPTTSISVSAGHAFGGSPDTILNASATFRLERANLSLSTGYDSARRDITFGVQLSTGLLFDPLQRRYRRVGAGAAAGGAAAVEAFIDGNGDGVRSPGEAPVPGLIVHGGRRDAVTDASGNALISGLGDAASARIRLDAEKLDNAYLTGPASVVQVVPRPGRVIVIPHAMHATSEIELSVMFARDGAPFQPLSSLALELVGADGRVAAAGRTEYDGALLLENVPAGAYEVRIEPEQARRLHMRLKVPVTVRTTAEGGFAGRFRAVVELVDPAESRAPDDARPSSHGGNDPEAAPGAHVGSVARRASGRGPERTIIKTSSNRALIWGGRQDGRPEQTIRLDLRTEALSRFGHGAGAALVRSVVRSRARRAGSEESPAYPGRAMPGRGFRDPVGDRPRDPVPAGAGHAAAGQLCGRPRDVAEHPAGPGAGHCRGPGHLPGGAAASAVGRPAERALWSDAIGDGHLPGPGGGPEPRRDRRASGIVAGDGPGAGEGRPPEDGRDESEAAPAHHHPDRRVSQRVIARGRAPSIGANTHA